MVFHFARPWLARVGATEFLGSASTFVALLLLSVALATGLFLAFERPYFDWKHDARSARVSPRSVPAASSY